MKFSLAANVIILIILLFHSVVRDLEYQKEGAGDLRNRVVGARLTKAGKDPYYYKWKTGDSYRYLDYHNVSKDTVSSITASPLFHHLLSPICNYPQRTIVYAWFILEYFALLTIIAAAILLCHTGLQKILVLNAGILFSYTHAWMLHVLVGQLYIFVAALLMLVALFVVKSDDRKYNSIIGGILTVLLIFIRPISCIILLPLMFSLKKHKWYMVSTFIFSLAYLSFVFINQNEKKQWLSYRAAMSEQVRVHQQLDRASVAVEKLPVLKYLEGLHLEEQTKASIQHPFPKYSENGNVFFVYKTLTRATLPVDVLYALYLFTILVLMVLFVKKYQKDVLNEKQVLLFALVLYMLTELFTPVYRHQYNTVQWLPLILLAISISNRRITFPYLLLLAGFILNIGKIVFIPMRHTIGEYVLLIGLLLVAFTENEENKTGELLLHQAEI